jgi:DNA-dependent protein kinase catalytic subunit
LEEGLIGIGKDYGSFYDFRRRFLSSYSVVCLVGYLLGVGDRHLDNLLVDVRTGEVIAIDFGYSFG